MKANDTIHRRLQKQLKRNELSAEVLPQNLEQWQSFLYVIDRSYKGSSDAQYLLERSLEVSSQEMRKLYDDLKTETEQRIEALHKSEQKTHFMANMSHELRTPIHGILGSLEIVKGTDLDERQQLFVDTAYASCEVMLDIINNILDFSKLRADGITLEIIEFSPQELVESISNIMSTIAQEKQLDLNYYIPDSIPGHVKGDPARLRQMLMNLISNAIKFTEEGEVRVELELREIRDEDVLLRFQVTDTGIGIPSAMQKSIFESFIQVDASINRRYGGTGLGLTIVREFAQMMGGKVELESNEDQGSRFWFDLSFPIVDSDSVEAKQQQLAGKRILVVDDNETNRQILENQMLTWQAQPTLCSNGHDALQVLAQSMQHKQPFDILLLDWFMPQMDGISLAKAIRAEQRYDDIPIVMLTSYGLSQSKQEQAGIQTALTKPVRASTLREMLTETLLKQQKTVEQNHSAQTKQQEGSPVERPAILLAEDNPVNALIAVTMLEQLDMQVDQVTNGKLALQAMRKRPYSLVLMDINMPEMDGYTATRYIRKWEQEGILLKHTPVIAMTANALKGNRERSLEMGMDDYLPKPVKQEKLLQVVNQWLDKQPALAPETS